MNKLVKITDIIDFGSQKGEQYFWIYRMHISYLEWLIEKTDYCFSDLSDFYNYGKIKRLKLTLSDEKKDDIINEVKSNNQSINNSNEVWLMTINNFDNLISKGLLTNDDFDDVEYKFSGFLVAKNAEKLKNSKTYSSIKFLFLKEYKHNFFYEN